MSRVYDRWEKLVGAVLRREKDRQLAYCESITTSSSVDFSSRPSFASDVPADDDSSTTTADIFRRSTFEWLKGEFLGHGSWGSVYEGINVDGFFFSVEEVSLLDQGDEGKQHISQLRQEITFLSQFEDENIVQYLGSDTDESHLHIFHELVSKGSLTRLYQNYTLGDLQVSSYTRQILHGLKYLHDMNVVHRMSRNYDNWDRLVEAVLRREKDRQLAYCESLSTCYSADLSSRFSLDSAVEDADFSFNLFVGDVHLPPGPSNWDVGFQPFNDMMMSVTRASSQKLDRSYLCSPRSFFLRDAKVIEIEEIRKATKNFQRDMILEKKGSVIIFKGWIHEHFLTAVKPGFGTAVAVHKLLYEGLVACLNEIYYLSELRHPNLVRLIGYCFCSSNNILVYESTPRGSLDNHLFGEGHQVLPWATRIKVALGAARALAFLHSLEIPVIHRDFKSENILLDDDFNAKLSDFSLAIDGPTGDVTQVSAEVVGTRGYADPEYIATGQLSTKCVVYNFGVVLLELICGLRVFDYSRPMGKQWLVDWQKPVLGSKKKLKKYVDSRLEGQYPRNEACRVSKIALHCPTPEQRLRPTMAEVVVALEKL